MSKPYRVEPLEHGRRFIAAPCGTHIGCIYEDAVEVWAADPDLECHARTPEELRAWLDATLTQEIVASIVTELQHHEPVCSWCGEDRDLAATGLCRPCNIELDAQRG